MRRCSMLLTSTLLIIFRIVATFAVIIYFLLVLKWRMESWRAGKILLLSGRGKMVDELLWPLKLWMKESLRWFTTYTNQYNSNLIRFNLFDKLSMPLAQNLIWKGRLFFDEEISKNFSHFKKNNRRFIHAAHESKKTRAWYFDNLLSQMRINSC